ncbi:MAG: hypothetical protein SVU88_04455, partial [Candidatus Nanohaloarchaea archaeon]|nr:hypothetical protein [Candidatus Nanohaloarchaea archaeon]
MGIRPAGSLPVRAGLVVAAVLLFAGTAAGVFGQIQHKDSGKSAVNADKLDGKDASDLLTPNNLSQVMGEGNSVGSHNLDMSDQAITNWLSSGCSSGQAVDDITNGGTISCVSISGESSNVYVNESGDVMTGGLNMSGERVMKIGSGRTNFTSTGRLDMSDIIDMNTNRVRNVQDPTSSGDALSLGYANTNYLNLDGTDTMNGSLDMDGNEIVNVDSLSNGTARTLEITS